MYQDAAIRERRPRVRMACVVALVVLVGTVAGCGMDRQATQRRWDLTDGVSADAGDVAVRNVVVVADGDGPGRVLASFVNRGVTDRLGDVRVNGTSAEFDSGPVELTRREVSLRLDTPRVDVDDLDPQPGHHAEVRFIFANAPRVTVNALIRQDTGIYADAFGE